MIPLLLKPPRYTYATIEFEMFDSTPVVYRYLSIYESSPVVLNCYYIYHDMMNPGWDNPLWWQNAGNFALQEQAKIIMATPPFISISQNFLALRENELDACSRIIQYLDRCIS